MATTKGFVGIILLPYIICFFAETGVWPSIPESMQDTVNEMSRLILTQRDDQIRRYCRGKFTKSANETIKSAILRKILRPFQFAEPTTTTMLPEKGTTMMMAAEPTSAPINQPTGQVTDEKPPPTPDKQPTTQPQPMTTPADNGGGDGNGDMNETPSKLTIGEEQTTTTVGINDKIDMDPILEEAMKENILVLLPFSYSNNADSI